MTSQEKLNWISIVEKKIWVGTAVVLCLFSIYTAFFGVLTDMVQRSAHLSLIFILIFLLPSTQEEYPKKVANVLINRVLLVIGFSVAFYHVIFVDAVANRWGDLTSYELWFGVFLILVLFEATRRVIGLPMVLLAVLFLIYAFVGPYLPGILGHRGYSLNRVVSHLYLGGSGIFGTPLGVSATFVVMIVIFGALLERSGAGKVLMDIATGLTGNSRGGPAKAAVVGSSLMGMVSGTAVANVLTTGTVSIPLMKRTGYRAHVAGAIEAVASTGGQLMPPVMGAAAFIMADMIERPYVDIAIAAIIPSFLYYLVLFIVVHLEAVKNNIPTIPAADCPNVGLVIRQNGHLLIPLAVFGWLLFYGYSVMYTTFWAVVSVMLAAQIRAEHRFTISRLIDGFGDAAKAALPVSIACATAGIIIGIITLTGLGLKFSALIISLSGNSLVFALVLTLIASLVLGMGLPTAAAYILVSTLVAPALVDLGVDMLAAHLFCFYGAMLSAITPPVAMAAYAAAGLAQANPFRIAVTACGFGAVAFIVPFFFVLNPALIGIGSAKTIALAVITGVIGASALACAIQGWMIGRLGMLERVLMLASGLLLIDPTSKTDVIGAVIVVGTVGQHWYRFRSGR